MSPLANHFRTPYGWPLWSIIFITKLDQSIWTMQQKLGSPVGNWMFLWCQTLKPLCNCHLSLGKSAHLQSRSNTTLDWFWTVVSCPRLTLSLPAQPEKFMANRQMIFHKLIVWSISKLLQSIELIWNLYTCVWVNLGVQEWHGLTLKRLGGVRVSYLSQSPQMSASRTPHHHCTPQEAGRPSSVTLWKPEGEDLRNQWKNGTSTTNSPSRNRKESQGTNTK